MDSVDDALTENRRLRRAMRDLVALSTLPAVWFGLPTDGIARGLAKVLLDTLSLELVYMRVPGQGAPLEVLHSRTRRDAVVADVLDVLQRALAVPEGVATASLFDAPVHLCVTRFGFGDESGALVTASRDPKFPTETDRLLLGVGANQTAIVLQRRRAEDRIRKMADDLAEADRRKNEFLATLAHELRNPLAPIRTGLQLLQRGDNDPQTRAVMERQLEHLVRLVDDLMDVSRITSGKIELRRQHIPLSIVVEAALDSCRSLLDQRRHTVTVELPPQIVWVDADLTRFAQVLTNVINNAGKYSEPGGHIRLRAEQHGSTLVISVQDTGIGIAAEHLSGIFDMFSQVDRSLDKAQGGLGIGLALVKRLVELHGGTVEARSAGVGKGAEVLLRLPVIVDAPAPRIANSQPGNASQAPLRILVVDDNVDGADLLAELLEAMGNEARVAYDGEQALAVDGDFRPDVVLLDLGLPGIDGFEVARRLPPGPAIVLVSSRDARDIGPLEHPVKGFIAKGDLSGEALREVLT